MKKRKVLYAEDDLACRVLFQKLVEKAGYACDVVENGNQAWQQYHQQSYDVIVLDQFMPGMDGEAVAAKIRRASAHIPLIAITSDDSLKSYLLAKGFNEVIVKPLRGNKVIDIIEAYM